MLSISLPPTWSICFRVVMCANHHWFVICSAPCLATNCVDKVDSSLLKNCDLPYKSSSERIWLKLHRTYAAHAVVPWQKYCLNHCARTCCSLHIVSKGIALRTGQSDASEAAETSFLSINLISFRRSCGTCFGYGFPGAGDGQRR